MEAYIRKFSQGPKHLILEESIPKLLIEWTVEENEHAGLDPRSYGKGNNSTVLSDVLSRTVPQRYQVT